MQKIFVIGFGPGQGPDPSYKTKSAIYLIYSGIQALCLAFMISQSPSKIATG